MQDDFFSGLEQHLGESVDYLREIKRCSEAAFDKFTQVLPLGGHREVISKEAGFIAHFLATAKEDCGTCVQIAVNLARKDGIADDFIVAVAAGDTDALNDEEKLVHAFVQATVDNKPEQNNLREEVTARLGASALVDLGLAMASARIFPTVKRAMGYAVSCGPVVVGQTRVPVAA